jgi:hypothetical protein
MINTQEISKRVSIEEMQKMLTLCEKFKNELLLCIDDFAVMKEDNKQDNLIGIGMLFSGAAFSTKLIINTICDIVGMEPLAVVECFTQELIKNIKKHSKGYKK